MLKKVVICLFTVACLGVGVWIWRNRPREACVKIPCRQSEFPSVAPQRFRYPCTFPRGGTPAESNAVAKAFQQILGVYEAGSVDVLRRAVEEMPAAATILPKTVFEKLREPLSRTFNVCFLLKESLLDFTDCADFERYAEKNVIVAKLLGNLWIRRNEPCRELLVIDRNTFRRFKCYRERFEQEGRDDFARAADRSLQEWVEQIEAECGFTRWMLWHHLDINWYHVETGRMTRAQLLNVVLRNYMLIKGEGYTPKWVDEFQDRPDFKWKEFPSQNGGVDSPVGMRSDLESSCSGFIAE